MFSTGMYCARYVQPHAGLLLNFLGLCANYSIKDLRTLRNKSSAVAEMGDCARAKWAEKGGAAVPLSVGGAGSPSNTMSPGLRPTSLPSGILIHPAVWPQYTNVTDRQDNSPIA